MNRPQFTRVTNVVTLRCNLKCKLCVICSPYYKNPWHPTKEYVNRVTDKLFEIASFEIFDFTGGEPLVHRDFPEIVEHALRYEKQVSGRFGFQSNGAILIRDDLVYVCKKFGSKIKIIMDDYGNGLSPYAEENYEILKSNHIPVELRHQNTECQYYDGWVDYIGDGTIEHSCEDARQLFSKCAQPQIMKFCCTVVEGLIMPCPVMYVLKARYDLKPHGNEYIDLFDDTESLDKKREKWREFYQLDTLSACKKCNGIYKDSVRYTPAIQLTRSELLQLRGE